MDRKTTLKVFSFPLLFLCLLISFPTVSAMSESVCIDENTLRVNRTEICCSDNATFNTTEVVEYFVCTNGCSSTLGACRPNEVNEALYTFIIVAGILSFCALGMFISERTDTEMYVATHVLASILTIILAVTDAFTARYRTIFLAVAFIPLSFIVFVYLRTKKEKRRLI